MDRVVDLLVKSRRTGKQVEWDSVDVQLTSADQAYEIQDEVAIALGLFDPTLPVYWKSGSASRSIDPVHAALPSNGVWESGADARHWPFHSRSVEPEIALRMGKCVDARTAADLSAEDAEQLIDAMCAAIEIVDSRWLRSGNAPGLLRLADAQSHGALVLGTWVPYRARHDWATQACALHEGRTEMARLRGSHPYGNPAWGLPAWLRHATRDGRIVREGTVVTTGNWAGRPLAADQGNQIHASFDGIGEVSVRL